MKESVPHAAESLRSLCNIIFRPNYEFSRMTQKNLLIKQILHANIMLEIFWLKICTVKCTVTQDMTTAQTSTNMQLKEHF